MHGDHECNVQAVVASLSQPSVSSSAEICHRKRMKKYHGDISSSRFVGQIAHRMRGDGDKGESALRVSLFCQLHRDTAMSLYAGIRLQKSTQPAQDTNEPPAAPTASTSSSESAAAAAASPVNETPPVDKDADAKGKGVKIVAMSGLPALEGTR